MLPTASGGPVRERRTHTTREADDGDPA